MQKLNHNVLVGNDRGSALVMAVVLAIIMAIGCIGFLVLTTNTMNNDSGAYKNDRAFQAAESCALIAYKWLDSTSDNWNATAWTAVQGSFQAINLNGQQVDIDITFTGGTPNQAVIKAVAFDSGATHNASTFQKRVVITAQHW